ncbi:MAG TPA: hypothetical protein VMF91_23515 [Bryobacteraceae bacterium]|nr:hypothetical protein [Bryobacteraceae bacterium]
MALKAQENASPRGTGSTNAASHATGDPDPGDTLESWKQIAAYLGRDERTAMRWEKEQGMPVRRTPGKRGRVYASRMEISAWLGGSAEPLKTEVEPRQRRPIRIQPKYLFGIAGLGLILAVVSAGLVYFRSGRAPVPARVSFSLDSVEALDANGRVLWTHHYSGRLDPGDVDRNELADLKGLTRIADLLGTGEREVLVVAPLRSGPNPQDFPRAELDCFSSKGQLLWSYVPRETFKFGDRDLNGPWNMYDVMVSGKPAHAIYLACNHIQWGNSFVVQIDPRTGYGIVRFVNTGTTHSLNELHTSRAKYLLVGGFNNEFDSGSIAAIDEQRAFAASPQTTGTRHKCVSCPLGAPDYYFVFPRSELSRLRRVYENPVVYFDMNGGQFEVSEREVGRLNVKVFYLFRAEPFLSPISCRFDSGYDMLHRELERSGELHHSIAECPERLHPARVRRWTPSQGWQELQINSVQ